MNLPREGFDRHGNPISRAYELGSIDDDQMRSERILLYIAYLSEQTTGEKYEWHHVQQAVAERNIHMDIRMAPRPGICDLDTVLLSNYTQLWFVSDRVKTLRDQHLRVIEDFVKAGNGLLIWADNDPFFADANLLAKHFIGTRFSGNRHGDRVLTPGHTVSRGHFVEHPLTQGVNRLYEGITICTIKPAPDLTFLAQSHDGQYCMACFERENQRIVLDTGFTKLHEGRFHNTAGTARYFRNIAFWLAKAGRGYQYTLLTPGRDSLAMLQPGGTSERYTHSVTTPTILTYVLQWEGTATLGLVVQNPQGNIVQEGESAQSPLRLDISTTETGEWICWARGVDVPQAQFPYVLTLRSSVLTSRPDKPPERPAQVRMTYARQWGATHPGCLIILVDQSGSMDAPFGGQQIGAGKRKCDVVATVLNNLLHEFVETNTVGAQVKPRANIAVLGYEGTNVGSILPGPLATKDFVSLPELMQNPLRIETRVRKELDEQQQVVEIPVYFPVWVEPMVGTTTPMCAALERARDLAGAWVTQHPDHYPPVVINITDGASTDGDPTIVVQELCRVATTDGETLLFNCHITNLTDPKVEFVSSVHEVPDDPFARQLFTLSSIIPNTACTTILNTTGYSLPVGARGFIFNGDAASIRQMFVFATVGATRPAMDPNR
jgi:hypothetical protein